MSKIVIVEDAELLRELMEEVLRARGHEVVSFGELEPARLLLEREEPDLLLTDVQLPDGSGLELVEHARARCPVGTLPIVLLSGLGSEDDLMRGFAAGADDYLTKPVSNAELVAKCTMLLARRARTSSPPGGSSSDQLMGRDLPGGPRAAFGRYRITGVLGQGGSGVVYSASALSGDEREVALKVPALAQSPDTRQRFMRETYTLSRLRHPNIVPVIDFGAGEGRMYCAMERVPGMSLAARVEAEGPASEAEVIALLRGLAAALQALAAADLVHRDVKPHNVVLRDDRVDQPVLVDFGLAKNPADRTLTRTGQLLGTPGYMAPEVILGRPIDIRSDLFSVGLAARFALTGEEVFPDKSGLALLTALAAEPIAFPAELAPPLTRVLTRLTRTSPDERYATPTELVSALDDLAPAP